MKNFLKSTDEEWKILIKDSLFCKYCEECGKEANHKDEWVDGITTTYTCDECKLTWDCRFGKRYIFDKEPHEKNF